jgi:hypothetical protein
MQTYTTKKEGHELSSIELGMDVDLIFSPQ